MIYGSETWAMKAEDMQRPERAERMMIRWMCEVTLKDRNSSEELRERLGIVSVSDKVCQGRLRWFGYVERKDTDDWVSVSRNIEVEGKRGRGRGRKTWKECVANDRKMWRGGILGNSPTRASADKRPLNR